MVLSKDLCVFLLLITLASCKPEIYSFSASPRIITHADSVHLHWKIRGNPELSFHQKKIRYFASDSLELLQFSLIAAKGSSRTAPRLLEIKVLPTLYRDILVFPVTGLHEDTLVAAGFKDSLYQDFTIESMALMGNRKILVGHGLYQTMLYDSGSQSKTFKDLDYSGPWTFQSLLTPAEKENPEAYPGSVDDCRIYQTQKTLAMAPISGQVDTIILVMMENRSFDHMLGHLSIDTPSMKVNGLSGDLDQYENDYLGTVYPSWERGQDEALSFDLPHEYSDVNIQLRKNPASGNFSMKGFVEAFALATQVQPNPEADPMGYFPARLTPVTDFLARNFCVCDQWFASLPTSTQPNRTMAFSGDSPIYQTRAQLIPIPNDIFHWMEANKVRWRVYHDGFSFFSLYNSLWPFVFGEQFRRTEFLYPDMVLEPADHAPQVIIIEPSYEDAPHLGSKHPNDNHAPLAVGWGEDFLRRTYQSVTANPEKWARTVMVLYYDEHGGFYDHVSPPPIGYTTTGTDAHSFESLGPRIPGIIISPLVKPGSICSKLFDHTSVLQFIAERFTKGKEYSENVSKRKTAGIQSIGFALNNSAPYPPPPVPTVEINSPASLGKSLTTAPSSEMGKSFELAALQMLEQKPAEVARKYPELFLWKETAAKSGEELAAPSAVITKTLINKKKVQKGRKGKS